MGSGFGVPGPERAIGYMGMCRYVFGDLQGYTGFTGQDFSHLGMGISDVGCRVYAPNLNTKP